VKELFDGGYVSRDDYDQADAAAKKADALRESSEAAVSAARADLERAGSVLEYSGARHRGGAGGSVVVRSPVAGAVLKLHRQSEGVVNVGEPLLDIGDPRNLEVRSVVLSAQAVKISKGMRVLFERWGGPQVLEGRVRVVEPAGFTKVSSLGVEEQRVLVIIDLTSPADVWRGLGDAYRLDAIFVIWEKSSVLQVPEKSALFRRSDGWAVFTLENKRAKLQEVRVGRRNGITAEIVSGIGEGTVVITHPDDAIGEGVKVKARSATREKS
jgi:HlyD family secretion protein